MKKSELRGLLERIAQLVDHVGENAASCDGPGQAAKGDGGSKFAQRTRGKQGHDGRSSVHRFHNGVICPTGDRGHATPGGRSPAEIVLDASEGFIPLWANGETLRWQFNEVALERYLYPSEVKEYVRDLMSEAVLAWGPAAPVGFKERDDAWDFEIVVRAEDDCDATGCVLASAFFPDAGRHQLVIYPKMFQQSRQEQIDTLTHETGHIFGLRHFFADVSEAAWPSEIFGEHRSFSIMNYGWQSVLTEDDKSDLTNLYQAVWSGELASINGTPIRLVKPFHASGEVVTPGCEYRFAAARTGRR